MPTRSRQGTGPGTSALQLALPGGPSSCSSLLPTLLGLALLAASLVSQHQMPTTTPCPATRPNLPLKGYIPSLDAFHTTEIHSFIKRAKMATFLFVFLTIFHLV